MTLKQTTLPSGVVAYAIYRGKRRVFSTCDRALALQMYRGAKG